MRSVRFFHAGQWKLQMYVLLLSAVNLVSSLVKLYACPVAVLGLTFVELLIEEAIKYLAELDICMMQGWMRMKKTYFHVI
jgi:hypothetical protein